MDDSRVIVKDGKKGNDAIVVDFFTRVEVGEKAWHVAIGVIAMSPGRWGESAIAAVSENNTMAFNAAIATK